MNFIDLLKTKLQGLGLEQKFILSVVSCVILSIALLVALVIRHETLLLKSDSIQNADVLAVSISRALKDNMLGCAAETVRLIKELSDIKGVEELTVLNPEWNFAFRMSGPALELTPDLKRGILAGRVTTFTSGASQYLVKSLANEKNCRSCHRDNNPIRGIVLVKISTSPIQSNVIGLMWRMAGFGAVTVIILSILLIILNRRMLISPIQGLTEAARQIELGNFALFRPRGTHCQEIQNCSKTECPSYHDETIPCWLESGTLCKGRPVGDFAAKLGSCFECKVYHALKGDELRQLIDKFNKMSLTLKGHKENVVMHVREVERINQDFVKSNAKLATLLEASRLVTSTLELSEILSTSLKIILDVTQLKAGVILLLEDDTDKKCYEYFGCDAYNCPAYKAAMNCWRLSGVMCHGGAAACPHGSTTAECWQGRHVHTHHAPAKNFDEKMNACSNCEFFTNIVLIPKMIAGYQNGSHIGERVRPDSTTISKALVMGQAIVGYSKENPFYIPIETVTELAVPLKMQDQMIGIFYLASDKNIHYTEEEIGFFQHLSEVISSGIFNSRLYDDMENSYLQTVMSLANAIEAKDPYTKGHTERVADVSIKIAEALHLSKQEKEHLRFGAILHDVGKIGINGEVLRKHTGLDEDETDEIKAHPELGVRILEPVHFLKPVLSSIRHHHEKYDGSGYPLGLKGKEIPFKARIITIADAWDAMRSNRPYRDALPLAQAREELHRHAGTHFDPELVDAFIRMIS